MISKPYWLSSWLDRLNWDIFTWHIYVGDAIESGIDWAIDKINDALDLGVDAWNKAVSAWDKAVEVFWDLKETIDREVDKLLGKIDTWWDELGDWWDAKKQWIKDWVTARLEDISDIIDDVKRGLASLSVAWETFRRDTLPNLIDRIKLDDWAKARISPLENDVAKHSSWFDLLKDLMADPEKWLLDRISSMLARFI